MDGSFRGSCLPTCFRRRSSRCGHERVRRSRSLSGLALYGRAVVERQIVSPDVTSHNQSGGITAGTVNIGGHPSGPSPPRWKRRATIVATVITIVGGAAVGVWKHWNKSEDSKQGQTIVNVTNNNMQTANQTTTVIPPSVKVTIPIRAPSDSGKGLPVSPKPHRPPARKELEMSDKQTVFNVNSINQSGG